MKDNGNKFYHHIFWSQLTPKSSMLKVLMKLPLLSLTAMEDADLHETREGVTEVLSA